MKGKIIVHCNVPTGIAMNIQRTYYGDTPPARRTVRWRLSFTVMALVCLLQPLSAQNFNNSGTLTNNGTIRVKNQAVITQGSVGGEIELNGADQNLPAKQYQHVRLSGTGTKTTTGGNLSVLGSLTIAAPVTLNITQGNIITLGDTLFESGILRGAIQKSVNLTGGTTTSDFGNIGATISWSGSAPGTTNVVRVSDTVHTGNGYESIKRYYNFRSADTTVSGDITLKFSDAELNGHDITMLQLWKSTDNGQSWFYQAGTVNTSQRTITKSNAVLTGRWTMADTLHPIGSFAAPGIPTTMAVSGSSTQTGQINTQAAPFSVVVRDAFNSPMKNAAVSFSMDTIPSGAIGTALSDTLVQTDSLGIARTRLTFGSKVGLYKIRAKVTTLAPVIFSANALHGPASVLALVKGNNQSKRILTPLDSVFTVSVVDAGANAVDSAAVTFTIASAPPGATGHQLSAQNVVTDSLGRASTILTLGNRAGAYNIEARVSGLSTVVQFSADAIPGSASQILLTFGNNQSAENRTQLAEPFTVTVVDVGSNPVEGDTVTFNIAGTPANAVGQQVSASTVVTSAIGQASTFLTLGNKTGEYTVAAKSTSLPGVLAFRATSLAGAVSSISASNGNDQTAPINTPVNLRATLFDSSGNAVPSQSVSFAITQTPAGANGQSLSIQNATSDNNGVVSTTLTLGDRVGLYEVTATVNAASLKAVFTVNAIQGTASAVTLVSGNNQSAQVGTQLQNPFVVRTVDAGMNPVANMPVTFSISAPANAVGETLSTYNAVTSSLGVAQTVLTLGTKSGVYKVIASVNGLPAVEFSAMARPGNPSALAALGGTQQTKQILNALDAPFIARVSDSFGNGVPQVSVAFAVDSVPQGAFGTALSDTVLQTDSLGQASIIMTLGSKVGLYQVSASAAGFSAVAFNAKATHGPAAMFTNLTGENQIKPTEAVLDTAFELSVRDIGDNPVPDVPVRFAVTSTPLNATGYDLSDTLMMTDSMGRASTYLQLGDWHGTYTVEASTQGVPQALFRATGYLIYGDINKDFYVNIADITSIIDFFNKKKVLSAVDSLKADFNRDGKIEMSDLDSLRESIMSRLIPLAVTQPAAEKDGEAPLANRFKKEAGEEAFTGASMLMETTPLGLRVNLQNTVPVRGIELRMRLNDSTVNINSVNLTTQRGRGMNVFVRTVNDEVHVMAYNLSNTEVSPDSTTLFRLPDIYALNTLDTSQAILALQSNAGVTVDVFKEIAQAGKYPTTFNLRQNYPNPFNGSTTIEYDVADGMKGSKLILEIFNILGQHVKTLVSGEQDPGHYKVRWDGTNEAGISVASGVYFYRFLTKDHGGSKKMIYLK